MPTHNPSPSLSDTCLSVDNWLFWQNDTHAEQLPGDHVLVPDRASVPAALRRRLSPTALASCQILSTLCNTEQVPLIYASRHGRIDSTYQMLQELAQDGTVSPARFSMSVHNAVAGVYSIANKHFGTIQAVSACGEEFVSLLLEALGYLHDGAPAVVAVFAEEQFPEAYHELVGERFEQAVVGLRLSRSSLPDSQNAVPLPNSEQVISPEHVARWLSRQDSMSVWIH